MDRSAQALKSLKAEQAKLIKPLRATLKSTDESLVRVTAQCNKLSLVADQLRSELGLPADLEQSSEADQSKRSASSSSQVDRGSPGSSGPRSSS